MNDDARLLHQFAEDGSEAAFTELVRRHLALVHSAARRQVAGDAHRAEEVTQAVFVELARQSKRLTTHRSLAGWLYTTARYVAARKQRAEQRRILHEKTADPMNVTDIESTVDWDDLNPLVDEIMHHLSPADREAVVLRFFQNRPLAQVGHALGVGENAARMRVARALERLRRELARRGITSTAAALSAALSTHAVTPASAELACAVCTASATTPLSSLGTLGSLAELAVALMTTKKWVALGTVVVTGAFVAPRLLPPPPASMPVLEAAFTVPSPAGPPPGFDPASGSRWDAIESADYRQFVANLRTSGAPERLIRDVVALEILRAYAPRIREAADPVPQPAYWQKPVNRPPTAEQQRRHAELNSEIAAILRGLFGPDIGGNEAFNVLYAQPNWDSVTLAWLPAEAAAQALAILEPILQQEQAEQKPEETGKDQERRLQRRLDALASVLTPEQLQEYRHRNSDAHLTIKAQLRFWDPTEDEFLRLAAQRDPRNLIHRPAVRMEDLREREAEAEAIFGLERTRGFLRATDLSYGYAVTFARQSGLPADTADLVWEIKRAALAEDEQLRLQSGLSPEMLQAQRTALVRRTAADLTALVGENGLRYLKQDWPWWQALEKP